MTFTVIVYEAEEGGYWAEVPELPGCGSQGETLDDLKRNIVEAIEACLDAYREDSGNLPKRLMTWDVPMGEGGLVAV